MKNQTDYRKVFIILEWIIVATAVTVMVAECIQPGTASGFAWASVAASSCGRCLLYLRGIRLAEESARYWQDICRALDEDVSLLCRENSELAGRLREIEYNEMDDLK